MCCVWLTHHCIFIYVLNTSGWQTLNMLLLFSTRHGSWFRHCSFPTIFSALRISLLISWINPSPTLSTPLPLYPGYLLINTSLHLQLALLPLQVFLLSLSLVTIFYLPFLPSRTFLRNDSQNEALSYTSTASHADIVTRPHVNQRNFPKFSVWFRLSEFNCFVLRHSVDISALWRWELRSVSKCWQHFDPMPSGPSPHGRRCCSIAWGGWIRPSRRQHNLSLSGGTFCLVWQVVCVA